MSLSQVSQLVVLVTGHRLDESCLHGIIHENKLHGQIAHNDIILRHVTGLLAWFVARLPYEVLWAESRALTHEAKLDR